MSIPPPDDNPSEGAADILQIGGNFIPEIDADLDRLLDKGRYGPVQILDGSESPENKGRRPHAITLVEIEFDNEDDLRKCVRLLRWSDERLKLRPDEHIRWDWSSSMRDKMKIKFGVNWYDKAFFEQRKDAFRNAEHRSYYANFGASPDRFKMEHRVLGRGRG